MACGGDIVLKGLITIFSYLFYYFIGETEGTLSIFSDYGYFLCDFILLVVKLLGVKLDFLPNINKYYNI